LWTDDMMVWKEGDTYYMFAEGLHDVAHLLTSVDKINWKSHGSLTIITLSGDTLSGPYGTPTVWREKGTWYLFYERSDLGIWLATSQDLLTWSNISDDPVIKMGPEAYDLYGVAVNQVVQHHGLYYAYYHGTAFEDWREWSTNVAVSKDLIHWEKYGGNPIMKDNKSSGILVPDGENYRLYTMHNEVAVHFPSSKK
jgi:sucrose-6-phosphate hydrolase SacC (GH32 family)